MSWTAPKIQAMLLKAAPGKSSSIRPAPMKISSIHQPSPRQQAAASKSGYEAT